MQNAVVILASASSCRARMLLNAGIDFTIKPAKIDERAVQMSLPESNQNGAEISLVLAQTKALDISRKFNEAFVIGSDQTLTFEEKILHKPENMDEARRRLLLFSGKPHYFDSSVALAKNGEILWSFSDTSSVQIRHLRMTSIGRYLTRIGKKALTSVGAYQIEAEGAQLIERIEGDFFSIMGMPLLPLLEALRQRGIIDE